MRHFYYDKFLSSPRDSINDETKLNGTPLARQIQTVGGMTISHYIDPLQTNLCRKKKRIPSSPSSPFSPWLINSPSNRVRANKQYHRSRFAFASSLTGILYRGTNDVCLPTIDRAQRRAPRFINNIAPQLARLNNRAL